MRNETITRSFGGGLYIELHFFVEDGEQRSMGDVTLELDDGSEATGSVDRLIQTGELTNWDTGEEVRVCDRLIEDVCDWIDEEGY